MELKEKVNKRNDYLKVSNAEIKALLPEIPVGGRLRFFLSHWEKITDDQWVLSVIKEGYKIEFNQIPPKTGIKKTNVPAKNLDILNMEVKSLIEKGAVEHVPLNDLQNGFLQYLFPCPQKDRGHETSNQSQTIKQVSPKATFQDGFFNNSLEFSKTRRLGNFPRSERCLYAYPDFQKPQKILKVLCKKQPLSTIHSTTVRPDISTSCIYKSSVCSSSSLKSSGYSYCGLLGRLVHNQSTQNSASFRSRDNTQSSDQFGLYDKCKKVYLHSNSENSLHRSNVSFRSGTCLPNTGKSNKTVNDNPENNEHENANSKGISTIVRNYGILYRNNSQCSPLYATTSNTSFEFLETIITKTRSKNSCYQTAKIPFEMVVQFSKHYKGQIPSTLGKQCDHNDRCFYVDRLGVTWVLR